MGGGSAYKQVLCELNKCIVLDEVRYTNGYWVLSYLDQA